MDAMSEQSGVRCVLMRGGTSKGLYFRKQDIPPPGAGRDRLLCRLMGSPDVLQIDGLGGSRPITSKVAIVGPSSRDGADVDYTFAQVGIDGGVGYFGNCGNISAGVGPFAIDEGMVEVPDDGTVEVRIWNTNTDKLLLAVVHVSNGRAAVTGDCSIPGVPGTGAEIVMNWVHTIGAKTGTLLPTGCAVDTWTMESGRTVHGTLCDAGNPVLWVAAADFGLTGSELSERIDGDAELIRELGELRGKAAAAVGFCADWRRAGAEAPGLPMLGLVARPAGYTTLAGAEVAEEDMDLRVRLIFLDRLHESLAGTGSMSLAAASQIPGSVIHAHSQVTHPGTLRIGHPSGVMEVRVTARPSDDPAGVSFEVLGMTRTARRLMAGTAYMPLD
jgi:2-methylaconitate cis-trans-isomerase PrpF